MKIQRKDIEKDGQGSVTLLAEEPEDMWHVYNLLAPQDRLRSSTVRKVRHSAGCACSARFGPAAAGLVERPIWAWSRVRWLSASPGRRFRDRKSVV